MRVNGMALCYFRLSCKWARYGRGLVRQREPRQVIYRQTAQRAAGVSPRQCTSIKGSALGQALTRDIGVDTAHLFGGPINHPPIFSGRSDVYKPSPPRRLLDAAGFRQSLCIACAERMQIFEIRRALSEAQNGKIPSPISDQRRDRRLLGGWAFYRAYGAPVD